MLNRRNLRIKVMQSLFALQQGIEANYQLCLSHINERFQPDLNSMEVQDKEQLRKQRTEAIKLFEESFRKKDFSVQETDPVIANSVKECFGMYNTNVTKDMEFFRKNLISEVEKIYDHYLAVLSMLVEFVAAARSDKKGYHDNFLSNNWVKALEANEKLKDASKQWEPEANRIKIWFRDVVRQDPEYLAYIDKKNPSHDEQRKFITYLFRKVILGKTIINDYFEEKILRWAEDKEIVKGLVEKSIKSYEPDGNQPIKLHTLSVNWEEDSEFIHTLYSSTFNLDEHYKNLIASNTRNWEVDRLPLTDRIILEMALAEMLNFPNIPVKVTINEYIELAKNYSTPKSRQFINGILDVLAKELKEEGVLRKSGRGLIDNK